MVASIDCGEQRVLLHHISWDLYENLLREIGDDGQTRLSYLGGDLEFMTPLPQHENYNRQIERAIVTIAEKLDYEYNLFGSMTIKHPQLEAGAAPDSCYYITNEAAVRGKIKIDFEQDPPPDLVVEIDITISSIDRLALYSKLGIRELWCFNGRSLVFYHLQADGYRAVDRSPTFPILSPARILEFLSDCQTLGIRSAVKGLQAWLENIVSSSN